MSKHSARSYRGRHRSVGPGRLNGQPLLSSTGWPCRGFRWTLGAVAAVFLLTAVATFHIAPVDPTDAPVALVASEAPAVVHLAGVCR